MRKKLGGILLIGLCIIQLLGVGVMLLYQRVTVDNLKEKGVLVTPKIDMVWYNEDGLYAELNVDSVHPLAFPGDNYLVFENVKNQKYSNYYISETKPEHDAYITYNEIYELNNVLIEKNSEIGEEYGWLTIYDRENESINIYNGFCEGPETDAYAVVRVYKGEFRLENIYIAGYPIEEYAKLCIEEEIDLSRYDFNYYYDFDDLYDGTIDDLN